MAATCYLEFFAYFGTYFILVQNLIGIGNVVLNISKFQYSYNLASNDNLRPFWGCFWVKWGKQKLITGKWHPVNQTA